MGHKIMNNKPNIKNITQNFREKGQLSQLVQITRTQLLQQVYTVQVKK
jgi:hypothetical protein